MSVLAFSNDDWKSISINNNEYGLLTRKENNVWKIFLTNLVELWKEELQTETIIERCKTLNPLLKIKALNVDEIMKEILTDVPNHSVEKSINSIKLHKNIQGGIFKFRIDLSKGSDEEFFEIVTKSLCLSSMELFRRYSILLDIVKKKDEEITEYKAEGAKLIRKNIETKRFNKELFNSGKIIEATYLDAFKSVVCLHNEAEKLNLKREKSPTESGKANIEVDENRKIPESSETLISTSETKSSASNQSRDNLKRTPKEERRKAKKVKSAISASYVKPVKKVNCRVSNLIS